MDSGKAHQIRSKKHSKKHYIESLCKVKKYDVTITVLVVLYRCTIAWRTRCSSKKRSPYEWSATSWVCSMVAGQRYSSEKSSRGSRHTPSGPLYSSTSSRSSSSLCLCLAQPWTLWCITTGARLSGTLWPNYCGLRATVRNYGDRPWLTWGSHKHHDSIPRKLLLLFHLFRYDTKYFYVDVCYVE